MKSTFIAVAAAVCLANTAKAESIELISRTFNATSGSANGASMGGVYSPDGKFILFSSAAPDLINVPNKSQFNLYLLNTANNSVQLVSAAPNGDLGSGASTAGGMSLDNRFAVFQSTSSNLVSGDTNGISDIFVRDFSSGTTTLVSHNAAGTGSGNGVSEFPQISLDGEWVVFQSDARDLAANDTNQLRDVFAWKRSDNSVRLVSAGFNGNSLNVDVTDSSLSPDGKFVLFTASGTNLVVANRASASDVYLYDLQNGTTRWISSVVTNLPGLSQAATANAVMSTDDRFVFMLAAPPTTGTGTLVRLDLSDNSLLVVSTNIPSQAAYSEAFGPSISDDGQFAAYTRGTNVYYWSSATGLATQVDVTVSQPKDGPSDTPVISPDGKKVAFLSTSSDLVAGVVGGDAQIYVRDMVAGKTYLITRSTSGDSTIGNLITPGLFSPDSSTLLFDSDSDELVQSDANLDYDMFSWNATTDTIALLSTSRSTTASLSGNGSSNVGQGSMSADGRYVAFQSLAQLVSSDTNIAYDAYVFDRVAKTNILVSAGPDGFSMGNNPVGLPKISANGTKVAFEAASPGLAGPTDTRLGTSVYVRDLQTGTVVNISPATAGSSSLKAISADGRYVFFTITSGSTTQLHRYNLVDQTDLLEASTSTSSFINLLGISDDGNRMLYFASGLYFHDFSQPSRILIDPGSTTPAISAGFLSSDGSQVIYFKGTSMIETNILTGQTNLFGPISVRSPSMSADARITAYVRPGATAGAVSDIWFLDRVTHRTNLVSHTPAGASGNGSSSAPVVSADGRFIAFESFASDLTADDNNGFKDVFVYDRLTDRVSLVSHADTSTSPGNLSSFNPAFAPAGSSLLFVSADSDLVAGDLNDDIDVFLTQLNTTIPSGDTDGDGLDDSWERANFSTLDFGGSDDPDGDGVTNAQEFAAGTNPTDATSTFALRVNSAAELGFKTAAGHTYQVESRDSLEAGAWQSVGAAITGDGSNIAIPISNSNARGFYRIRLVQ